MTIYADEDLGDGFFKVVFNFLPVVIIAMLFTEMMPPAGIFGFVIRLVSAVLGYCSAGIYCIVVYKLYSSDLGFLAV